jgi:hypothetical protein
MCAYDSRRFFILSFKKIKIAHGVLEIPSHQNISISNSCDGNMGAYGYDISARSGATLKVATTLLTNVAHAKTICVLTLTKTRSNK